MPGTEGSKAGLSASDGEFLSQEAEKVCEDVRPYVKQIQALRDQTYGLCATDARRICSYGVSEREVERLLDCLLSFADDRRILELYKCVCRAYLCRYPKAISDYVYLWYDYYDKESLVA